jgi:hypothetical protein
MSDAPGRAERRTIWARLAQPGLHWVGLSFILYIAACILPAMPPIFGNSPVSGWDCLASLMYTFPAWWANPLYFVAIILCLCRCHRVAAAFAVVAALLASSFQFMNFPNPGWWRGLNEQESGCICWIMSTQMLAWNLAWKVWRDWNATRIESL